MNLALFALPPAAQRQWLAERLASGAGIGAQSLGWTPASVIDRWSAVIASVMRMPAVKERFISLGLEPTGTTLAELAAIMAADTARWAPNIKASGFIAD